jgi:hypothetical protein
VAARAVILAIVVKVGVSPRVGAVAL